MTRQATPPVFLRAGADRHILTVDASMVTTDVTKSRAGARAPLFLEIHAGIRLTVKSRRIRKLRFPVLIVEAVPGAL